MNILYVISMLMVRVLVVTSSSTILLYPHRHDSSALYWMTTGYKLFNITPPGSVNMGAPITFSHFIVHVFINHDPLIASVYLPDLFSNFPDSAWRLPQEVTTPARPELPDSQPAGRTQGSIPPTDFDQHRQILLTDPRLALGRHIFHQPIPNSTTLHQLLQHLENEFDLDRKLIGTFTIFPQNILQEGGYPEWHNKPLPWNMTLSEIAMLDHDAVTEGQYVGVTDQYAPVLHLVAETKAATLKRNVGGIHGKDFHEHIFGKSDQYPDIWSRFEAFTNCYSGNNYEPEIVGRLRRWRWASSALQYLVNQREKRTIKEPGDEDKLQNLTIKIEEFEKRKAEAKESIWLLASQWENWILEQNYDTNHGTRNEVLNDDEVEDLVRVVLRQRSVVEQWARSGKSQALRDMLRKAWFDEKDLQTLMPVPAEVSQPNISDEQSGTPEESPQKSSILPQDSHQEPPEIDIVQTVAFRGSGGTLNPEYARFTISSGVLSWGQILPIYFSSTQDNLTNNAESIPSMLPGGTIKQHVYTYKSAARVGDWRVRQYYSNWRAPDPSDPDGEKQPAGWVICHDDIDPLEVLKKVRAINPGEAISNGNGHIDKDVLYIGRYDWSHHWHNPYDQDFEIKFHDWASKALHTESDDTNSSVEVVEIEKRRQLESLIIEIRNKLQDIRFKNRDPIKDEDLIVLDDLIFQLEELPHLDAITIRRTKIMNPLFDIQSIKSITNNDKYRLQARCKALREKYFDIFRANNTPEEPLAGVETGGYFIAMDSENFDAEFVGAYKRDCEMEDDKAHEFVFRKGENAFGTYVSLPHTGYEFGWLVFSGKKHAEHDADELIAIVYDGTYEVFAGLYHKVEGN